MGSDVYKSATPITLDSQLHHPQALPLLLIKHTALHNMSHLKIAIAGAGPAEPTLAPILHLVGIPFTIYELDPSREHRYEQCKYLVSFPRFKTDSCLSV